MNKKYKLTSETKTWLGITLFRIEATVSFGNVSKGEKGGWIEKEENLEVYGDAWVYGDARVYGNAQVYGNAWVYGNALVYGNAQVYGKIRLTLGYFFGWRNKEEKLTFIDNGDGDELIGKDDCEFEYYDDKPDTDTEEAIALLKKNGYKIVKE